MDETTNLEPLFPESPVHDWFELSYAQFLTVPRLVMEAMPLEWQRQMAALLQELDDTFDWRPHEGRYWVRLRDANGRFADAPLWNYRRGSCEHLRWPGETQERCLHSNITYDTAGMRCLDCGHVFSTQSVHVTCSVGTT